jgi:predicted phage terminase large subunit-like protein
MPSLPTLKWTGFIPHQPTVKQLAFLLLPHGEALFGGAAGGGKSDALLMAALQYVDIPGYASIIFRKTLSDLKQPGALIDRSHQWLYSTDAKWVGGEHAWYFPTVDENGHESHPSKLVFGYVGEQRGDASNVLRYQGIEVQYVAWDELTQHDESDYRYLFSRRRRLACPVHRVDAQGSPVYVPDCPTCERYRRLPLRVRAATNPGGPGAVWVKRRFRIGPHLDPREADRLGVQVRWVGKHPRRPFIPSFLEDNPFLDQTAYDDGLRQLDPVTREQLRRGNWGISPDSRFKRAWARYFSRRGDYIVLGLNGCGPEHHLSTLQKIFCTVDPAGSVKESPGAPQIWRQAASYTVISVWGLTNDFNLLWLDMIRFRREIPDIVDQLRATYRKWRPAYFTIEANGLGRGIYQYAVRSGLPVRAVSKTTDKLINATDAMVRMKEGKVWLPEEASWLETCEDELFTWTGHPHAESDDIIDTLSDAAREVSWEAAGNEQVTSLDLDLALAPQDIPTVLPHHLTGLRQGYDPYSF